MTRLITLFAICLLISTSSFSQNESNIILTVAGEQVTKDDFVRVYSKNNKKPSFDKASLEEYMDLFINFKLKVKEAESLGMDTLELFVKEFEGYKRQLEKPYFKDESIIDSLAAQAYERMKWEVKASHILIKTTAEDTLDAYKKISDLRKRAIKGEDFDKMAREYSEDPSAKVNSGDLGFFTAFRMVAPFEDAAFSTPVGEISGLVRTRFGYHILKVTDKRPSSGEVLAAHIMKKISRGSSAELEEKAKKEAYLIYDSIMMGLDFEEMALKYSEDQGTAQNGGKLPQFGSGRMVPEFEEAAFAIDSIGKVAEPIQTKYGWHIIKLLGKTGIGTFEEEKDKIYTNVRRSLPSDISENIVLNRLKDEYGYEKFVDNIVMLSSVIDSSALTGQWKCNVIEGYDKKILTIGDSTYVQLDLLKYIEQNSLKGAEKISLDKYVKAQFGNFSKDMVKDYERARLPIKHPEYKNLVKEYHDGILLFNLTDSMVWSKAVKDTAGLNKYYEENKSNYMWGKRVDATVYIYSNAELEDKVVSLAKKVVKKNADPKEYCAAFQAKVNKKDSTFTIVCKGDRFSKGEDTLVDDVVWTAGSYKVQPEGEKFKMVYIHAPVDPEPKKLNEAKGLITADYQSVLEKEWLASLREKYEFKVNEQVLNSLVE